MLINIAPLYLIHLIDNLLIPPLLNLKLAIFSILEISFTSFREIAVSPLLYVLPIMFFLQQIAVPKTILAFTVNEIIISF